MLLVVSLILIGIMCSMRVVSLHMIEREKIEERYVYCPKCNTEIRKGNSAPFCSKCNILKKIRRQKRTYFGSFLPFFNEE